MIGYGGRFRSDHFHWSMIIFNKRGLNRIFFFLIQQTTIWFKSITRNSSRRSEERSFITISIETQRSMMSDCWNLNNRWNSATRFSRPVLASNRSRSTKVLCGFRAMAPRSQFTITNKPWKQPTYRSQGCWRKLRHSTIRRQASATASTISAWRTKKPGRPSAREILEVRSTTRRTARAVLWVSCTRFYLSTCKFKRKFTFIFVHPRNRKFWQH